MPKRFKAVSVGGTFDKLHKGHKALLMKAFEVGEHVFIGLCTDEFIRNMGKPHVTASYERRFEELRAFLSKQKVLERAEIISLNDVYGNTLAKDSIEALVVSKETESIAFKINNKRGEADLPPLQIVLIDMVDAENNSPISTTRIRRGEIDREGHLLKTSSKYSKPSSG
jgi:cytidyltransferase-like protein